jgi:hypothetical protein
MLTATATAVGWRVDYDIVDSVFVGAVDGIE